MAILELQENGRIQMLYNKWWKNRGTCNNDEKQQEKEASSLGAFTPVVSGRFAKEKPLGIRRDGQSQVAFHVNSEQFASDNFANNEKWFSAGLANVGGIFVVLVTGLALAVISAVVEFVYNGRKHTNDKVPTFLQEPQTCQRKFVI